MGFRLKILFFVECYADSFNLIDHFRVTDILEDRQINGIRQQLVVQIVCYPRVEVLPKLFAR